MTVAIVMFPGANDHENTLRAARAAGIDAEIVRWNTNVDWSAYEGYIIPGGWSYEDRIRAGVIAAKNPVMQKIKEEAAKGKPVLGICNGAQVLVESGMIPGTGRVEMALAPNTNPFVSGYYCTWATVKPMGTCAFINGKDTAFRIPIAHGEGRFTTNEKTLARLKEHGQIVLQYCTPDGTVQESFPTNPNGSDAGIAGLSNPEGNVLAMMPHPERSSWQRQVPGGPLTNDAGPGRIIFRRMKEYMEARR